MRQTLTFALLMLTIASCSKQSSKDDNTTPPIDPAKKYTINYDLNDQIVKTSVTNNTLNLDYYEQVNFIVDPSEYGRLWALILTEDITKSNLKGLHFSALNEEGTYATDWVSQNLNNVHSSQKITIDTTIGDKTYKKIKISRIFKFISPFTNQQAAIDKQNDLITNAKNDSVSFSTSYYYSGVYSLPNNGSTKIVYTK
jgi:hypothetical protein